MPVLSLSGTTNAPLRGGRPDHPRSRIGRGRRIAALVAAVLLLATGGATLLAAWAQRGAGGYFTTPTERFLTPTAALKSDEIDLGAGRPADTSGDIGNLGTVRIRVSSADPDTAVFVGIGPKEKVDAYLRGLEHDELASVTFDPFRVAFRRAPGSSRADRPDAQSFWTATSAGVGARTLEWNKERGAWSMVVMNLSGAPGIDVRADLGLRFGLLLPAGIGFTATAAFLLAFAVLPRRASFTPRASG
jgi:hypothetical protein